MSIDEALSGLPNQNQTAYRDAYEAGYRDALPAANAAEAQHGGPGIGVLIENTPGGSGFGRRAT